MTGSPAEREVARVLAQRTGTSPDDWYCVYRERHGMLLAFEAARETLGEGAVVTQLLTCCTAVDPILAAGLVPRYGELSARTAALDPAALRLDATTRAVVIQHTYGIVDDAASAELARRAHEAGALAVEDCAHCVGRMARDEGGEPVADVSFHSFGSGKMLRTVVGGAVWVNPASPFAATARALRERLAALPASGRWLDVLEGAFINQNRLFNHIPRGVAMALRHGLARLRLFEPAVSVEELRGKVSHDPMRLSERLCRKALDALAAVDETERMCAAATEVLRAGLVGCPGVEVPAAALAGPAQPLLRLPVLVRDTSTSDRLIAAVRRAGYYTEPWYRPALTPGVPDEGVYHVPADRSGVRVCDDFVARVTPLPTDRTEAEARQIVDIVREVCS